MTLVNLKVCNRSNEMCFYTVSCAGMTEALLLGEMGFVNSLSPIGTAFQIDNG